MGQVQEATSDFCRPLDSHRSDRPPHEVNHERVCEDRATLRQQCKGGPVQRERWQEAERALLLCYAGFAAHTRALLLMSLRPHCR